MQHISEHITALTQAAVISNAQRSTVVVLVAHQLAQIH